VEIQAGINHGLSWHRALSWSDANSAFSRQCPPRSTKPGDMAGGLSNSA